jgi:TPR repeat protein
MRKFVLSAILLSFPLASLAAVDIPDPSGRSGTPMKTSDFEEKLSFLKDKTKDQIGFKEGNSSAKTYREYVDTRSVIEGGGSESDKRIAVKAMYALAKRGLPSALNYIGVMLSNGYLVERDDPAAAKYFYEGAKRGDLHAKHNYGVSLILGRGAIKNEKSGVLLLEQNAAKRLPYSAVACGIFYENRKEWGNAIKCYQGAFGFSEHPIARTRVAMMQIRGRVSNQKNFAEIKVSLNQAAKVWWPEAQWTLADMARYGIGSKPDPFQTAFWLRILAQNPNAKNTEFAKRAEVGLGELYLTKEASDAVNESVGIWLNGNQTVMPVIDYTRAVAEPSSGV